MITKRVVIDGYEATNDRPTETFELARWYIFAALLFFFVAFFTTVFADEPAERERNCGSVDSGVMVSGSNPSNETCEAADWETLGVTKEEIAEAIMVARQAKASTIFATAVDGFEQVLGD
jgi:hypothetical protein